MVLMVVVVAMASVVVLTTPALLPCKAKRQSGAEKGVPQAEETSLCFLQRAH